MLTRALIQVLGVSVRLKAPGAAGRPQRGIVFYLLINKIAWSLCKFSDSYRLLHRSSQLGLKCFMFPVYVALWKIPVWPLILVI